MTLVFSLCHWSMEWRAGVQSHYQVSHAPFNHLLANQMNIVERRAAAALGALLTRYLQGYAAVQSAEQAELAELEALEERERRELEAGRLEAERSELVKSEATSLKLVRTQSARVAAEEARLAAEAEAASSATFAQFQEFLAF
uniref:Uncharacterized protein n=2 Tax=Plectus sambesii TaxID=2011161 RepID=A0A914UUN7_9BILA